MKVIFYISAARGLGQITRSIKICQGLQAINKDIVSLFITGSSNISHFILPINSQYVKLPYISKNMEDEFVSNGKNNLTEIIHERKQIIYKTITNFEPDVVFIDRNLTGVKGELLDTIIFLKESNKKVKIYFNTRDIIDEKENVIKEWTQLSYYKIIEKYIDHVFIFGKQNIYNFTEEYQFTEQIKNKTTYCGYIPVQNIDSRKLKQSKRSIEILVTVGGGIDGYNIINCFIDTFKKLNDEINAKIVLGPDMPETISSKIRDKSKSLSGISIYPYTPNLIALINTAEIIISMAGYNTLTEIIYYNKKAILIPRTTPTKEQLMRAKIFSKEKNIKMIYPEILTPLILQEEIEKLLITDNLKYINFNSEPCKLIYQIINSN